MRKLIIVMLFSGFAIFSNAQTPDLDDEINIAKAMLILPLLYPA